MAGARDRRPIRQRPAEHYSETELDLRLRRPHPQRGDVAPSRLVDRGEAEAVHALVDRMDDGALP